MLLVRQLTRSEFEWIPRLGYLVHNLLVHKRWWKGDRNCSLIGPESQCWKWHRSSGRHDNFEFWLMHSLEAEQHRSSTGTIRHLIISNSDCTGTPTTWKCISSRKRTKPLPTKGHSKDLYIIIINNTPSIQHVQYDSRNSFLKSLPILFAWPALLQDHGRLAFCETFYSSSKE